MRKELCIPLRSLFGLTLMIVASTTLKAASFRRCPFRRCLTPDFTAYQYRYVNFSWTAWSLSVKPKPDPLSRRLSVKTTKRLLSRP